MPTHIMPPPCRASWLMQSKLYERASCLEKKKIRASWQVTTPYGQRKSPELLRRPLVSLPQRPGISPALSHQSASLGPPTELKPPFAKGRRPISAYLEVQAERTPIRPKNNSQDPMGPRRCQFPLQVGTCFFSDPQRMRRAIQKKPKSFDSKKTLPAFLLWSWEGKYRQFGCVMFLSSPFGAPLLTKKQKTYGLVSQMKACLATAKQVLSCVANNKTVQVRSPMLHRHNFHAPGRLPPANSCGTQLVGAPFQRETPLKQRIFGVRPCSG